MRKVNFENLARLTNGKLQSFAQLVKTEGESLEDESIKLLINKMASKSEAMTTAMNYEKTNEMTSLVEEASDKIDTNYSLLRRFASVMVYSSDESTSSYCNRVNVICDKHGNLSRMTYEDKVYHLSLMLIDMKELGTTVLEKFAIKDFYTSLIAGYQQLNGVYLQRNSFRDLKRAKVAAARAELEEVLGEILHYLMAMASVNENIDKMLGDVEEFFTWNVKSNKKSSAGTESEDTEAESSDTVDNEASKGELADDSMES